MAKIDTKAELLRAMMATPEGKPVNTLEQAMVKPRVAGDSGGLGVRGVGMPLCNVQVVDLKKAPPEPPRDDPSKPNKVLSDIQALVKALEAGTYNMPPTKLMQGEALKIDPNLPPLVLKTYQLTGKEKVNPPCKACDTPSVGCQDHPNPHQPPVHGSKATLKVGDTIVMETKPNEIITLPKQHFEPKALGVVGVVGVGLGITATVPKDPFMEANAKAWKESRMRVDNVDVSYDQGYGYNAQLKVKLELTLDPNKVVGLTAWQIAQVIMKNLPGVSQAMDEAPRGYRIEKKEETLMQCIIRGLSHGTFGGRAQELTPDYQRPGLFEAHIWLDKQRRRSVGKLATPALIEEEVELIDAMLYGKLSGRAKDQLRAYLKTGAVD